MLEKGDLRIDDKIAICRAAGDLFNQVLITESSIMQLKQLIENNLKPKG